MLRSSRKNIPPKTHTTFSTALTPSFQSEASCAGKAGSCPVVLKNNYGHLFNSCAANTSRKRVGTCLPLFKMRQRILFIGRSADFASPDKWFCGHLWSRRKKWEARAFCVRAFKQQVDTGSLVGMLVVIGRGYVREDYLVIFLEHLCPFLR